MPEAPWETPTRLCAVHAPADTAGRILLATPGPRGPDILMHLLEQANSGPGRSYVALESSTERLCALKTPVAQSVRGQVARLPFKSRSFAVALTFETLFAVRPPWTALAEFHRVLQPDGLFFLYEPASEDAFSGLRAKLLGPGKRVYAPEEVQHRVKRAGFEVLSFEQLPAPANYPRPAYALLAKKLDFPIAAAPVITTTREMRAKQKAHPTKAALEPKIDPDQV